MNTQTKYRAALTCAALLFSLAASAPAQTNATPAKPKIGIMKFEVASDLKPSLGQFLYSILMEQMLATQRFTVVDWEEIDRLLGYMTKAQPNLSPDEARKQAVHQLGLEKMYLGSVSKVGSRLHVTVKILNLDLLLERAERLSAASEDELEAVMTDLAKVLVATPDEAKAIRARIEQQRVEKDKWAEVQRDMSEEKIEGFLKEFPESNLASEAKKSLEEIRAKRLAQEAAERDKKQPAEDVAKQQAKTLEAERRNNIAGTWQLIYVGWNQNWSATISQQGQNVTISCRKGIGRCVYTGTLIDGQLEAHATGTTIVGKVSEDGNLISGKCSPPMVKACDFELTRTGPSSAPR